MTTNESSRLAGARHLTEFLRANADCEVRGPAQHVAMAEGYARLAETEMADALSRGQMYPLGADLVPVAVRFAEMHAAIAVAQRTGTER